MEEIKKERRKRTPNQNTTGGQREKQRNGNLSLHFKDAHMLHSDPPCNKTAWAARNVCYGAHILSSYFLIFLERYSDISFNLIFELLGRLTDFLKCSHFCKPDV